MPGEAGTPSKRSVKISLNIDIMDEHARLLCTNLALEPRSEGPGLSRRSRSGTRSQAQCEWHWLWGRGIISWNTSQALVIFVFILREMGSP